MDNLYAVYQGELFELDYTDANGKYLLGDNPLNKRVIMHNQLNMIHGKRFNAYIIGFDMDKIIQLYITYMDVQILRLEDELNILQQYKEGLN